MTLFFCLCVSYEADLSRVCPVSHPILLEQFPALSHPEQDKQFKDGWTHGWMDGSQQVSVRTSITGLRCTLETPSADIIHQWMKTQCQP